MILRIAVSSFRRKRKHIAKQWKLWARPIINVILISLTVIFKTPETKQFFFHFCIHQKIEQFRFAYNFLYLPSVRTFYDKKMKSSQNSSSEQQLFKPVNLIWARAVDKHRDHTTIFKSSSSHVYQTVL